MTRQAKILTIDDSLTMRRLVEMVLTPPDFALETAETGGDGLAVAKRMKPDLILLDYVLPDMNGVEVCAMLQDITATAKVPILVISGKGTSLSNMFAAYPEVKGFVPKPFRPQQIRDRVIEALAEHANIHVREEDDQKAKSIGDDRTDSKRIASLLYSCLQDQLGKIPQWLTGLGDHSPAKYFAQKILTPEIVKSMADEMRSILATAPPTIQPQKIQPAIDSIAADETLCGSTAVIPLTGLLEGIARGGKTGVLHIDTASQRTYVYIREGIILAASANDSALKTSCPVSRRTLPKGILSDAEKKQRIDGTPVFVTLAAKGEFPPKDLPTALTDHTRESISLVCKHESVRFSWRELGILPAFVDAHGQGYPLELMTLEQMRAGSSARHHSKATLPPDSLYRRCRGFSKRIEGLPLNDTERLVLTLLDGRHTVAQIEQKGTLAAPELHSVIHRLASLRLILRDEDQEEDLGSKASDGDEQQLLMALDSDALGVLNPLSRIISHRIRNLSFLAFDPHEDLVEQMCEHTPDVIMLDQSDVGPDIRQVAERVRSTLDICDTRMIATTKMASTCSSEKYIDAGFDLVLRKPFLGEDLVRFLRDTNRR